MRNELTRILTYSQLAEEETDDDTKSVVSSTASLTSTIFEYRTHHGRTYHGEVGNAEAWEPNDQRHTEAMDLAYVPTILSSPYRLAMLGF